MPDSNGMWWDSPAWNPVTGCTPVSAGCDNCWAKRMHDRHLWGGGQRKPFSEIALHHDRLEQPLHWRKPRRVAVCLMGDLFHDDVPEEFVVEVFHVMYRTPRHIYFVLTKRPDRMAAFTVENKGNVIGELPNVGLGTSIEDQATADERMPHLLKCPAAMRFISIEPMLAPIPRLDLRGISWCIVGSESGPGARPMNLDWVRSLVVQCKGAGIPLFYKQRMVDGRLEKMPMLDGRIWDEIPGSR